MAYSKAKLNSNGDRASLLLLKQYTNNILILLDVVLTHLHNLSIKWVYIHFLNLSDVFLQVLNAIYFTVKSKSAICQSNNRYFDCREQLCVQKPQYCEQRAGSTFNFHANNLCEHFKQSHHRAWTGPEASRRLRLPDFKIISTWRW